MIPRRHLVATFVLFVAACGVSAGFQKKLPDPCPIHWNIHGQVDNYGSPMLAAWLMPGVTLPVFALLIGLPMLGPFRRNIEEFRVIYGRVCVFLAAIFLALHVLFMLEATGVHTRFGPTIGLIIGVMFMVLGNWMGKMRRNLYIGIRTPWTIASDLVWEKTHRLGGKLFVAAGLVNVAVCPFAPDWICFVVLMGSIAVSVMWSIIYSLYCYRKYAQSDDLSATPRV